MILNYYNFFTYSIITFLGYNLFIKKSKVKELEDDILYLTIFKDKCIRLSDSNERLSLQNKSYTKWICHLKIKNKILQDKLDIIVFNSDTDKINMERSLKEKNQEISLLKEKKNQLTQKEDNLETKIPFTESEFGSGPIRFSKEGIFYHGAHLNGLEGDKKWMEGHKDGTIWFKGNNNTKLSNRKMGCTTHDIDDFCNNCIISHKGRVNNIYICQGHSYN